MTKIVSTSSTMVGENFEIYMSQMAKIAFKLSIIVGETFSTSSTMVGEILKFTCLKWLELHLNCPP